jgi:hypothetical protein
MFLLDRQPREKSGLLSASKIRHKGAQSAQQLRVSAEWRVIKINGIYKKEEQPRENY